MMRVFRLLACSLFLMAGAQAVEARKLALLIGVADYDNPSIRSLSGPRNDVILLWRHLTSTGFEAANISVLAEGLPEGSSFPRPLAPPTRAAIMAGFRDLADRAAPGDFVVLHFSGHGTTQPETGASKGAPEAGDRDQVLLPKDAGDYDSAARTIRNGIVDDEIGEALDAIRAKGAFVWVIVDACHAGTVTRSGSAVTRGAQPEALGVPRATSRPALRSGAQAGPPQRNNLVPNIGAKASLVGFFAVDSWTEAIEREFQFTGDFAPGPNGGPPRFGVFTYHLVRALNVGRARTFRDLARVVSLDIASSGSIAQSPLPYFDGDLDLTLQGGEAGLATRFPAALEDGKLIIDAGSLHGFDEDSTISIFDGPVDDAKRIGSARIQSSEAARATAAIDGTLAPSRSLWVSVEAPAVALRYRVGVVAEESERTKLMTLLTSALSKEQLGQTIEIVEAGERDIDIRLHNGSLWLTPEGRSFDANPNSYERSFAVRVDGRGEETVATELRRSLFSLARAANLVRIASAAALGGAPNDDLQISMEVFRESDPAQIANAKRDCSALSQPAPTLVMRGGDSTSVSHCDQVRVLVTNTGDRDMFVGVFYLTPTGGVALPDAKWRQSGCVAYLPARSTSPVSLLTPIQTWTSRGPTYTGVHRVLVFALPRTQTTGLSLCHLQQPDVESARREVVALRKPGGRNGFLKMLDRIASAEPALRANPFEESPSEASSVVVRQFTLDVRPPAETMN